MENSAVAELPDLLHSRCGLAVAGCQTPATAKRGCRPAGRVGPVHTWITAVDPCSSVVGPPSRLSPGSRMDAWVWIRIIASMGAGDHEKGSCRNE